MTSLATRAQAEEQMDDPSLDPAIYDKVLEDLARVNRWTLSARPTLAFLARATRGSAGFRLLDIGFGQGDMLRNIANWARRCGLSAELVGVDLNPKSEQAARAATRPDMNIDYSTGDYKHVEGPFDFVISSFVAHHMTREQLLDFIRFMEAQARRGWLVNDLHRRRLPYVGYPLLARMLRVHRIVREDGTLSIARSFRVHEWRAMLDEAGVTEGAARIVRRFPYRLCVERLR